MSERLAITITGPIASGKTYWARKIAELLEAEGKRPAILDDCDTMSAAERQRRGTAQGVDVVIYTQRRIPR